MRVEGRGFVKRRMLDMGLTPGVKVKIVRVAPLGDPLDIVVRGYNLSIRKNEASLVIVREVTQ
ncbi:MAG: FeoA domain-containing protein [Thermoproteales archaeon]|nr:FeoA domain-containing protein [Thermoproteales archaeon]